VVWSLWPKGNILGPQFQSSIESGYTASIGIAIKRTTLEWESLVLAADAGELLICRKFNTKLDSNKSDCTG